jgi:hypothetical protein
MVVPVPLLRQREVVTLQPSMAFTGYGPKGVIITLTTWAPKVGARRTRLMPTKRIKGCVNAAGKGGCQVAVAMLVMLVTRTLLTKYLEMQLRRRMWQRTRL